MSGLFRYIGESGLFSRKTPRFWHHPNPVAELMLPFSVVYFLVKRFTSTNRPAKKFPLKIICVGNAIAGGAGKTPAAIAIHKQLSKQRASAKIAFVTTGFKAKLRGPLQVDKNSHGAKDVGDEALMLAQHGDTIVCKSRLEAVEFAAANGFEYLILDDGLHDKRIHKDISFLVIDGKYGFGNGLVLPAGPLRDRLDFAVSGADQIILIGKDESDAIKRVNLVTKKQIPVINSFIEPTTRLNETQAYVAFAGIGRPQKFFDMLKNDLKLNVVDEAEFADHHNYSGSEIKELQGAAKEYNAKLITTEKDFVKLPKDFAAQVDCVQIELQFENKDIQQVLEKL